MPISGKHIGVKFGPNIRSFLYVKAGLAGASEQLFTNSKTSGNENPHDPFTTNSEYTEQYVRETLAKNLRVVDFSPSGAGSSSYRDIYLLRKP